MSDGEATQAVYLCTCGFTTPNSKQFTSHVMWGSKEEGKGTHVSKGLIDPTTGVVIKKPYHPKSKKKTDDGYKGKTVLPKTRNAAEASALRFVPKIMECSFTPIMRAAREVTIREWGWDPDMPLETFFDTILHAFFEDRDIILAGYIIRSQLEDQSVR